MQTARQLPTVIGPTENALRALLAKILTPTRIKTYEAWVVLNAANNAGTATPGGNWQLTVADALKIELGDVDEVLSQLRAAGLISNDDSLTAFGTAELDAARSRVSATTSRLVDGLSEEEQATARLALDHVRHKAEELLRL
jgi:DNA-binding MarR family transcriptional regulator